jgi:hypothetical protein
METNSSEESFLPKGREAEELRNPEPNPGLREQTGVYKARKKG